ncbi:MAG: hypothetical protein J0L62_01220 [Bacteroidetes bacterium]|nr:hypothetical protein [Bacteroidota bacterium]
MIRFFSTSRLIPVIALLLVFIQVNRIGMIYGLFFLKQQSIANSVCEKKVVACDGKCYLKKQVKAVDEEEQPDPLKAGESQLPKLISKLSVSEFTQQPAILPGLVCKLTSFRKNNDFQTLSTGYTSELIKPPVLV